MRWIVDIVVRWPWAAVPALLITAGVFAFAGVTAGLVPIKASSGHWPITEWFLHFAMRRSIITHSLTAPTAPEHLDSAAMVFRGAGHYESGCRPCHGAPGDRPPTIPYAMTPPPPDLAPRIGVWDARELFYIVKHGVKFTGMPAWPTQQRDDEVWATVAFLRKLPQLTPQAYQEIVRGSGTDLQELMAGGAEAAPPSVVVEVCARCHGSDGNGRGHGAFPKLAGQRLEYMMRAMHAYAEGRRHSGIMQPLVVNLPEDARHRALEYYASLPPMSRERDVDPARVARGASLALSGLEEEAIPACVACHGAEDTEPAYPRLAGQYAGYLAEQLRLLQERRRGGSEFVGIMHVVVNTLSHEQIDDLAAYFASAPAAATPQGK